MLVEALPLGWIFPGGDSVMKKGSEELLWVSNIVPLACVMHEGKVGPAPVIIDVRKEQRFPVQAKQQKHRSHFSVIPELLCSCRKWKSEMPCRFSHDSN